LTLFTGNTTLSRLCSHAFPPLGRRQFSSSKSATRKESIYNVDIQIHNGEFGVLDDYTLDHLKGEENSNIWTLASNGGHLDNWIGEADIQGYVELALKDIIKGAQLKDRTYIAKEHTFSISRMVGKHQDRVDVTTIVNDTMSVVGVCEVKLPGVKMDVAAQVVDYMLDLRNSFSVRYVFGLLTTYEEWRIFWFSDTNQAAQETDRKMYDDLCLQGSATDYIRSDKVDVYASRVYHHTDTHLVEVLASLFHKSIMSPIAFPVAFIDPSRIYVKATTHSVLYQPLPRSLATFTFDMPSEQHSTFHILKYFHRGGDGRVALCCNEVGQLGVLKFAINPEKDLNPEATLWNQLWGTHVRVVSVNERSALLMPFCLHIRVVDGQPKFCGLREWSGITTSFIDHHEVKDKINVDQLAMYQENPSLACRQALERMCELSVEHDDWKWQHVALWPKYNQATNVFDLQPIFIDLTRVKEMKDTREKVFERMEEMMLKSLNHSSKLVNKFTTT
jgi:hypothetical protein